VARLRSGEPWFAEAYAALEAVTSGEATQERFAAMSPFFYGRWDEEVRAYDAAQATQRNDEAAAIFGSDGAFDPIAIRAGLATLDGPVLVLAGEVDINTVPEAAKEVAGLFPDAEYVELPGAGHFPWMDDGDRFDAAMRDFLE
jgi:proline iminopeptidase